MAPVPIALPVSAIEPVKIVVSAMSFPEPHTIGLILMFVPRMFIVVPCVLITAIILGFFALFVPMFVLSQRRRRHKDRGHQQRGPQQSDAINACKGSHAD